MNGTHDQVQALIARCLTEPAFLTSALEIAALGEESAAQTDDFCLNEAAAVALIGAEELTRIGLFQGFITKVHHNGFRKHFRSTLQLLSHLDLELDFFVTLTVPYVDERRSGPLDMAKRVEIFERQLLEYAEKRSGPEKNIILDVFSHEKSLWLIPQMIRDTDLNYAEGSVKWRGAFLAKRFSSDILAACKSLEQGSFAMAMVEMREPQFFAYWRSWDDGTASVFRIDALSAMLLTLVDGRRSVAEIGEDVKKKGIAELDIAMLGEFYEDAEKQGLVILSTSN